MKRYGPVLLLLFLFSASALGEESKESSPPNAEEKETDAYPRFSLGGSLSSYGGYDDNISITSYFKPSEKQGSGTSEIKGSIMPELQINEELSTSLAYRLDQSLYYSNSDLDTQNHAVDLALAWSSSRLEASIGYTFSLSALVPKGVFYSLEHEPNATVELLLAKPFWVGLEYRFHFYDIHDEEYSYLDGYKHKIILYPELYIARKLTLYAGYQLEVTRFGEFVDTAALVGGGAGFQITTSLSYTSHSGILYARFKPKASLALILDASLGKKIYQDSTRTGAGAGPGGGSRTVSRSDTLFEVQPKVTWEFIETLSLEAKLYYGKSSSSLSMGRFSSSYDNLAAALGVRWEY